MPYDSNWKYSGPCGLAMACVSGSTDAVDDRKVLPSNQCSKRSRTADAADAKNQSV